MRLVREAAPRTASSTAACSVEWAWRRNRDAFSYIRGRRPRAPRGRACGRALSYLGEIDTTRAFASVEIRLARSSISRPFRRTRSSRSGDRCLPLRPRARGSRSCVDDAGTAASTAPADRPACCSNWPEAAAPAERGRHLAGTEMIAAKLQATASWRYALVTAKRSPSRREHQAHRRNLSRARSKLLSATRYPPASVAAPTEPRGRATANRIRLPAAARISRWRCRTAQFRSSSCDGKVRSPRRSRACRTISILRPTARAGGESKPQITGR